jgi:hypothetical protein
MSAVEWLLDSDLAIRWQAMRDLTESPPNEVAAERARVATEGWGAELLARQGPDGLWGSDTPNPEWVSLETLLLLRHMGLDPQNDTVRRAVALYADNAKWHGVLPQDAEWHGKPFFAGEVEPCINGRVVTIGAYFGQDVRGIVDRLLGEQMADGGWNCEDDNGATVGSFHTTINVLEGLAEYERATDGSPSVANALKKGQEYLLQRRLFRRLSTGQIADQVFTQFSFPNGYHYDVLRALDHLRDAGAPADDRVGEAVELVNQKRDPDGRWNLDVQHPNHLGFDMGEEEGRPSRWITLQAMRVLRSQPDERSAARGGRTA